MAKAKSKSGSIDVSAAPAKKVAKKAAARKNPAAGTAPAGKKAALSPTPGPVLPEKEVMPAHIVRGQELGLSLKQIEFVEVYLTCYNGTRSYMEVYAQGNYNLAGVEASRMLRKAEVRTYLGERMKAAFERTDEAQERLISAYTSLAYGDVNELVEYRRESCRYCHGIDNKYQSTRAELERARKKHELMEIEAKAAKTPIGDFDELGGDGFNPKRVPNPECAECFGDGVGTVHFHDTRNLSPAALALYDGAEITKDGIKVKTSNRDGAREKLAKIMRLFEEPKQTITLDLSAETLDQVFGERMRKARERAEQVRQERGIAAQE